MRNLLKSFGRAILLLPLFGLAGCGNLKWGSSSVPQAQEDCGFVQNVYGQRISWKGRLPIVLRFHESVPRQYWPAFETAIRTWEKAVGKPLFQFTNDVVRGENSPKQDGANVIYWMKDWEANRGSEQARTSVYWVSDELREADLRINAKDFTFYIENPQSYRDVHLESLVIHELGHILGLKHKETGNSVMGTYLSATTVRSSIANTDVESIRCEY